MLPVDLQLEHSILDVPSIMGCLSVLTFESLMMEQGLDPYGAEELGEFIERCLSQCGSRVPLTIESQLEAEQGEIH